MEGLKQVLEYLARYKGRLIGLALGFTAGLLWAIHGWWPMVAFLFSVFLGYAIGLRHDRKDSWRKIIERILPPTE